MDYEVIDISGDVGIRAFGAGPAEVFAHAALGMYSLITDPGGIGERESFTTEVRGETPERLLVGFLNELIYRFDTAGFVGGRVEVEELRLDEAPSLRARIYGEELDAGRHERRLLLKAATYHRLHLGRTGEGWEAAVVFDI